jgi:hypothetical protein
MSVVKRDDMAEQDKIAMLKLLLGKQANTSAQDNVSAGRMFVPFQRFWKGIGWGFDALCSGLCWCALCESGVVTLDDCNIQSGCV